MLTLLWPSDLYPHTWEVLLEIQNSLQINTKRCYITHSFHLFLKRNVNGWFKRKNESQRGMLLICTEQGKKESTGDEFLPINAENSSKRENYKPSALLDWLTWLIWRRNSENNLIRTVSFYNRKQKQTISNTRLNDKQ